MQPCITMQYCETYGNNQAWSIGHDFSHFSPSNMQRGMGSQFSVTTTLSFFLQTGLVINHHASNTLESFGRWAERNNNPLDNDENHYDYATLFTRWVDPGTRIVLMFFNAQLLPQKIFFKFEYVSHYRGFLTKITFRLEQ